MKLHAATIPAAALKSPSRLSYYRRQKGLFVLLVLLVSVLPLLVLSWTAARHYEESWLARSSQELRGLLESRRAIIDLFLRGQEDLLAGTVELHGQAPPVAAELERLLAAINRRGVITDLGVIGADGRHLAYVGPYSRQLAGRNYQEAAWFREVMASGRYVSDVFSGFRGVPHIVVAVTSPDRSWLLRATINSEFFDSLVTSAEVGPGGDAFIVNRRDEFQTRSKSGRAIDATSLPELNAGDGEARVERQGDFLYASVGVKNNDWLLVLAVDIRSSLAGFYRARQWTRLLIAGAGGLVLLVAAALVHGMVNRIETADRERLQLNDRIRQAEKMALVGRLAAGVAHEINNPLQIIGDQAGYIEELLEEETADSMRNQEECRESATRIRAQVKRASTITHRLLGFSRARETGRRTTDVGSLLRETFSFLEKEAANHRIAMACLVEENLPLADTDPGQLQQVFLNILNNALDAVEDGGRIAVEARHDAGRIVVEFADSGPGLAPASLARLFDPFFTTKERGKGTGLGLSISYSIMQRLGGDIQARNNGKNGAVFTVTLPAKARQAA